MAANLGTRAVGWQVIINRFMLLSTINHQVSHGCCFLACIFVSSWWNCSMLLDLLQDVIRFDQQINYASSASAWTDLSFSDHFAVSWAGAVAAVAVWLPRDFLSNFCATCEVSSSSPFRDFTPSRLEKVECFSFKLQLHCTGTMKDACILLRFMLQKKNVWSPMKWHLWRWKWRMAHGCW